MLLDLKRKKDVWFFEGAAFCQSPHSGTTGIETCSPVKLGQVTLLYMGRLGVGGRGSGFGGRREEGGLRSGKNSWAKLGTDWLTAFSGLWKSSQHKGIINDFTRHVTMLTTSGYQDLRSGPNNRGGETQEIEGRGGRKLKAQEHKRPPSTWLNTVQASYYSLFINYYFTPCNLLQL